MAAITLLDDITQKRRFYELCAQLDIPYGAHPRERFDLFLPEGAPKGLAVIIHGGFWLAFDKSVWSDLAEGALAMNIAGSGPSVFALASDYGVAQRIAAQMERSNTLIEGMKTLMESVVASNDVLHADLVHSQARSQGMAEKVDHICDRVDLIYSKESDR
mgnify:CR=1 FL=1